MRMWWHRIEHWLGWNIGTVESEWRDGSVWVCFRCGQCGKLSDWYDVGV
jgi:hypothetical protein